jgi:hypothetical protein
MIEKKGYSDKLRNLTLNNDKITIIAKFMVQGDESMLGMYHRMTGTI